MTARPESKRRTAFTLIEVIVSLALTVLVMTVGGRMLLSGIQTQRFADTVTEEIARTEHLFAAIEADLERIIDHETTTQPPIAIRHVPTTSLSLRCLAPESGRPASLHLSLVPSLVNYRMLRGDDGKNRMVRSCRSLTGLHGARPDQLVASGVRAWRIEYHDGIDWRVGSNANNRLAKAHMALRVSVEFEGVQGTQTRTFLLGGGGAGDGT